MSVYQPHAGFFMWSRWLGSKASGVATETAEPLDSTLSAWAALSERPSVAGGSSPESNSHVAAIDSRGGTPQLPVTQLGMSMAV